MNRVTTLAKDIVILAACAQATYGLVVLGKDLTAAAVNHLKK